MMSALLHRSLCKIYVQSTRLGRPFTSFASFGARQEGQKIHVELERVIAGRKQQYWSLIVNRRQLHSCKYLYHCCFDHEISTQMELCTRKIILCRHNASCFHHNLHKSNLKFKEPRDYNDRICKIVRRHTSSKGNKAEKAMNVFDRNAKRTQRNLTAKLSNWEVYEYLKEEMGWRMADRICDVKRHFNVALELGCGRGDVGRHIYKDMVGTLLQCDMAEHVLKQSTESPESPTLRVHCDEEFLPFKQDSLDLVVSSLSLHWVNDLPSTFRQVCNALKNDGCFLAVIFGGDTLFELRVSLQLAETERQGGFAAHISPFVTVQDLGSLLNQAGYTMLTIDVDEIVVNYPSMFELMHDLKGMGENNCSWSRRPMLQRDTMTAAAAIYKEMYGNIDKEGVPATFQFLHFIAWKPDPSQPKPATRGSGEVSLKDIDKLNELGKQLDAQGADKSRTSHLVQQIERLQAETAKLTATEDDDDDGDNEK